MLIDKVCTSLVLQSWNSYAVGLCYAVHDIANHGVLLLMGTARDSGGAFALLIGKNVRMTAGFLFDHLVLVSSRM